MKYFKEILLSVSSLAIGYGISSFSQKKNDIPYNFLSKNTTEKSSLIHTEFEKKISSSSKEEDAYLISKNMADTFKEIIKNMNEHQLNSYLTKAFPNTDLSRIQNKKEFAERLLEELSSSDNSSAFTIGTLTLSKNMESSTQSDNINQIYRNQQLFAHYDTLGKVTKSDQVFVKWTNQDTGEILLFTPQKVNDLSDQNWISYSPPNGWEAGNYEIEFYEFNDHLSQIAKGKYQIRQVLD